MKKKKIILIFTIGIFIIAVTVFRNIQFGYYKVNMIYDMENSSQTIELGVPRLSFMGKENDKSYSYKNIRSKKVLTKEVKSYLNTLIKLVCNNTTYYYDSKNDFTIINYSIKNHLLYNTISYEVRYGDYCFSSKISEYAKKLGGIARFHMYNNLVFSLSEIKEFTPRLVVAFLDGINFKNKEFTAKLEVKYLYSISNEGKDISKKEIEKSTGTYEIKDGKLYYTRTNIELQAEDIDIPKTSVFEIKNNQLILVDNYLSKYDNNIILK